MNRIILAWLLMAAMFFKAGAAADSTLVSISVSAAKPVAVKLQRFESGMYSTVDSCVVSTGSYQKRVSENLFAFYKLVLDSSIEVSIIVSGREPVILLAGDLPSFYTGNYVCFESDENKCWLKLKSAQKDLSAAYANALKNKNAAGVASGLAGEQTTYNQKVQAIAETYPATYCARFVAANLKSPVIPGTLPVDSFLTFRLLDSLHMEDERLLLLPDFFDMLKAYKNNFVPSGTAGQRIFAGTVFSNPRTHSNIRSYLLNYYAQWYLLENNAEMVTFLLELNRQVIPDTGANGQLITAIRKLIKGNPATDVELPDSSGIVRRLSDLAKTQDVTLLLFYAHDCDHCRQLIPKLKEMYSTPLKKTFGVFAVDVNPDTTGWKNFISQNQLPFVNTFLTDSKNTELGMAYAILSIPTLVLVDREMKIVSRFADLNSIKKLLAE